MSAALPFVAGADAGKDVEEAYVFDAILQPNTSLEPRGSFF